MSCKEIAENVTYTTELIREIKAQTFRYFILCVILSISFAMAIGYIIYDRYLDSQFEITEITETIDVMQDGQGYNSYIDGIGDIINGTEDKKDNSDKIE